MTKRMALLLTVLLPTMSHAQNLVSTTTTEVFDASQKYNSDFDSVGNPREGRRNPNEMESVNSGKTLTGYGINSSRQDPVNQYHGQKDRYDVALLRNDDEVLVSGAKHSSGMPPLEKKHNVDDSDKPIVVITNHPSYIEYCDENGSFM